MSTATDNVTTRPSSLASDGTDGGSGPSTDQAVEVRTGKSKASFVHFSDEN